MTKKYNWGIIGLGKIAHKFAADLLLVSNANLYAVASRSVEKAQQFAVTYGAEKAYGSYEALANDPNIDVVYVATPHVFHCEITLMCLDAGRAVLCEKAFGMNEAEVQMMINKANAKNLFLMEALWTRFIPCTEKMLTLIDNQEIGDIQLIKANFGFRAVYDENGRLFNKELGGGALLDIGIYPVYLALLLLGKPQHIEAFAQFAPTGVDSSCAIYFDYGNGRTAVLDASLVVGTSVEATIHGSTASLRLNNRFHHTEKIEKMDLRWNVLDVFEQKYVGNGYYHEILEVIDCLEQGKKESDKMPLSLSLLLIQTLDRIKLKAKN